MADTHQPSIRDAHAAGQVPVAGAATGAALMNLPKKSFWQRYRLPILLGIIAACLYLGSIVWMVYGRGQVA